jgi:hypothetical protein
MSLPDPDHVPPPPGSPMLHPLAAASVVIYATLGLLAITIPRGFVNWSRDIEPGRLQEHLLPAAHQIDRMAQSFGIERPYERARAFFLAVTGKSED